MEYNNITEYNPEPPPPPIEPPIAMPMPMSMAMDPPPPNHNNESIYNLIDSSSNIQPYDMNECEFNSEFITIVKNEDTVDLIEMKEILLTIINKKEELVVNNEEYKNEEIDELLKKMNELFSHQGFNKIQDELIKIEKELEHEIHLSRKNIRTLETFINFVNSIAYDDLDKDELQSISKTCSEVGGKIYKNNKLETKKKEYIQKRKELNSYVYFIQKLNHWNISNICPICFTKPVNRFLDPCGHTFCEECLDKSTGRSDDYKHCMICRKEYQKSNPLFFV